MLNYTTLFNNERTFMIKYLNKKYGNHKKVPSDMSPRLNFKQFFTPQKYSQVMIDALNIKTPKKIIDLAIGGGSLLVEAIKKWKDATYYGNDIDKTCCKNICENHDNIKKCFNEDIFERNSISKIRKKTGKVDLCVGNPPFDLIKQDKNIREILKNNNLDKLYKSDFIPAEVIFILQCFEILSKDGTLALILPDGFFVNSYLEKFRDFLITNYKIEKIVELPSNIFKKTDAKTHILILNKSKPSNDISITLIKDLNSIQITKEQAINRMDYNFYSIANKYNKYKNISNLDIEFVRGKSKYLIKNIKYNHILHTTSFSNGNIVSNNLRTTKQLLKYKDKIAQAGDIIIARVGSSCLGKVGMVEKGYFVATDCVFIIRVKDIKMRNDIFKLLQSKDGQEWIKANSKGVAAKHITLKDIKKFPISKMI